MTLNKRERTLLVAVIDLRLTHTGYPYPRGTGWGTMQALIAKGLVGRGCGTRATPLGRFIGTPLEWEQGDHRITADFPGGYAIVHSLSAKRFPFAQGPEYFNWGACVRGRWSDEPLSAETPEAARAACEAWVNAERLRVAGGDR